MENKAKKVKLCKHCQMKIPRKATICPYCRKKQGGSVVKWIAIVAALIIIISVVMPNSNSKTSTNTTTASSTQDSAPVVPISNTITSNTTTKTTTMGVTIEQQEVYKNDGISIVAESISETNTAVNIRFVITNETAKDYSVSAHTYSVNNLMVQSRSYGSDVNVPSGKKANLDVEIKKQWLTENGISNISDMGIIFWGYYDYFKEWDSGVQQLTTNYYNPELDYTPNGTKLYEDDNVEVWLLSSSDKNFKLSIKNKSTYNAGITIDNCSVNGWAYEILDYTYDLYDEDIHTNCYKNYELEIDNEFLTENGFLTITDVEFNIHMEDSYWNYKGAVWEYDTPKITILQ
jgi:RNA polymerase subunit RPABC4/transcription elongation factor Spt4